MAAAFNIDLTDRVSPALQRLIAGLEDPSDLYALMAGVAEKGTRDYIVHVAAPTRHTTANRLGAQPTGYLERAANGVRGVGTQEAAEVIISGDVGIFSRTDGPVTITPKAPKKYLTLPAIAEAYGRRAGEFADLSVLIFRKRGSAELLLALGTEIGEGANKERTVFYWLKKSVTLPQDRELLPSDDDYLQMAEEAADKWIEYEINRQGGFVN